ncbi:MAG: mechanosensitive ion channel family protein [Burkholderiales bacterium]|nr:MAG: mechanosensitive ion channel family protein [Burkholderiales bacterium]
MVMRVRLGRLIARARGAVLATILVVAASFGGGPATARDTAGQDAVPSAAAAAPSAPAAPAASPAASAAATAAATATAAAPAAPPGALPEATLKVFNRTIVTMRAPLFATTPADRARRARLAIDETLALGGPGDVETETLPFGVVVKVDGRFAFIVQPDDADRHRGETADEAAAVAVARLREAISATREARDLSSLVRGLLTAAAATLVAVGLALAIRAAFRAIARRLLRFAHTGAERLKVRGTELLQRDRLLATVRLALGGLRWTVLAVIAYEWLGFVLGRFAYTRPWGDHLNRFLLELLSTLAGGILGALPDLLVAVTIFGLAAMASRGLAAFLDRAARTPGTLDWLDVDTVGPAKRLGAVAIWLFALAMAYPYLPGSETEAFKGLSVLVGVMISLGGSSLIGQGASGLVLMYTRTLRVGEFVNIDGNEGTIVELGTFTTRMRTGRGEELTLPNSMVMGTVTRNYSRTVQGRGFVLDTEVTIGYDTPWRQVHAMLIEAARRTPGVLVAPEPKVFQTALSDFYPQYRLVCQAVPDQPRPRAEVLSALHANIQDVFNENGVQIMSPHYRGDPADPKWVPQDRWAPPLRTDRAPGETPAPAHDARPQP